ncbi:MAG: HAMP domain-containing histidine kinase [Cytophagaceae bacterium]|nr:MAG: HAMP domain-containing histidine kinase [Cytophagaceae bacterium]
MANAARREREGNIVYDCIFLRMRQRDQYENELILAKRIAEQANQAKADFLSMMSHELRTPLGAIAGFTQIIASGIDGPLTQAQQDDLGHIQAGSDALLRLINDILSFAHMDKEGIEVAMERVDVGDVIGQAEALVKPLLYEAALQYNSEMESPGIAVLADPGRLQQIVLNLLTNTIKFTPPGGNINVIVSVSEDVGLIQVQDSGRGIPVDQLQRVFEPFVQVNRLQVESSKRGVGLGLAICRKLARAMGGDVTATSTLGQGSIFTISLPLFNAERDVIVREQWHGGG